MSVMASHGVEHDGGEISRWGVCFAVVMGLHVLPLMVLAWWLGPLVSASAPPPSAIMVDMAPLPAAPASPATEITPGPMQQRVETPKPPEAIKQPKMPAVAKAAVALPSQQDEQPHPQDKTPVEQTTAPPAASAPPAPAAAPGSAAPSLSTSASTWQGLVLGRLEQFKRYPAAAQSRGQQGIAYLRFTMDRDGKVLSAKVERSSGYDLLDQETLGLIQRAQPLPKPPPEVPGAVLELVTPIEFFISQRK